jgi:hypothetical protein
VRLMATWIAGACAVAGLLIIIFGFILDYQDALKKEVTDSLKKTRDEVIGLLKSGENAPSEATKDIVGEFLKALTEFAKALAGLSQASQAFLISAIFFVLAATVAGVAITVA